MVTITKSPKRTRIATAFRTAAISAALLILLWVGLHWLSLVSSLIGSSERDPKDIGNDTSSRTQDDNGRRRRSLPKTAGAAQPEQTTQQLTESILTRLDELSRIVPLSPESKEDGDDGGGGKESEFLSNVRKECVPGRDDSGGEINPTTRRRRECLRHVPLGKKDAAIAVAGDVEAEGLELEGRVRRQRPRIGIMVPPGRISASFAAWVEGALRSTGEGIRMDVEVVTTSRAPVYGYGKSHGYTKLVRFVALPAPLAAYDAYLWASSDDDGRDSLRDAADEMKLGRNSSPPSSSAVGRTLQLILRWHCRLSHVSAHTAMLTISLEDVLRDPADALARILGFVWREDWEWEGHGGKHPRQGPPPQRGWKRKTEDLIKDDRGGSSLKEMLEQTSLVLGEATSSAGGPAFRKSMQGAFASEMKRSADMTAWPCPSFWEGVESGDGSDETRALRRLSGEMVPNCSDDDPFARCAVKKDRCEVKRDAPCK